MEEKTVDVVVIGGGPSGSIAAALLAKEGIEVTVLEKEHFPRYTVGESLIPHFWKFTDLIGASEAIEKAGFIRKSGGAALWNQKLKAMNFGAYNHDRPGLHVERDEFDQILLDRARTLGAHVQQGSTVKEVKIHKTSNAVVYANNNGEQQSITCKFLIDASGQSAVVSKQLKNRNFDPDFRFQAFWGYFDESDYLDKGANVTSFEHRFSNHPMSLVSGTGDWGWAWHLVMKNKVSVGAMIPRSQLSAFKDGGEDLKTRFLSHLSRVPLTGKLLTGELVSEVRTIRDYAYLPSKLAFDHCYITGDAAGFADPINSEGVTMGLYGGMMAAWAIKNTLKNERREDFYRDMYISSLEKRYKVFQLLSYPREEIAPHLIESCKEVVRNQSESESNLILAHLMVTNRAKDYPEILDSMDIDIKKGWRDIELDKHLLMRL